MVTKKKKGDRTKRAAKVVRLPEVAQISIPTDITYLEAAQHLEKMHEEEQRLVRVDSTFSILPWAGAYAVQQVLQKLDATRGEYYEVQTPMGPMEVQSEEIQVKCSSGTVDVFWGSWTVATVGEVKLWMRQKPGSFVMVFGCQIECIQKRRGRAEKLMEKISAEVGKCALYKGSCIALRPDEKGRLIINDPPEVYPVPETKPSDLILERSLYEQINAELFTPIVKRELLDSMGKGGSRGILFAGRPGTGKTLSSRIATRLAVDAGWSAFYLPDVRALEASIEIAAAHSPSVLVCEDIDRVLSGNRTSGIDRILNALDGLDKSRTVIFIATTNEDSLLPAPLLRPGRLHSLIQVGLPDSEAAGRLLRLHLGNQCPERITQAAMSCANLLPASIEEVAKRSILHAVAAGKQKPTEDNIVSAAHAVQRHQKRIEAAEALNFPSRPAVDLHMFAHGRPQPSDNEQSPATRNGTGNARETVAEVISGAEEQAAD